jgi:hypothetical protein
MAADGGEAVLITGVYGAGKSSVAEEIAFRLERRGERFALLDLDYLGWASTGEPSRAAEFQLMLANLAAVAANYRQAGIRRFVLAYFARDTAEVDGVRQALDLPLRVVRLAVPLAAIQARLAPDATSGRRDDLREAADALASGTGAALGDVLISNDRPLQAVAGDVLTFLGWEPAAGG